MQVLRKYIPEPAVLVSQGITEAQFYASLSYYWSNNRSSFPPFDPVALTAEMEAQILMPIDKLRPLFERAGYLTRLATFISPEEMTKDPLFVTNRLLANVSPTHMAVAHVLCGDQEFNACDAPMRVDLEDGRSVVYRGSCGGTVDRSDIDLMPSAETAWNRDADTEGQLVVDNRPAIMHALAAHNASIPQPGSGCGCSLRARPRGLAMLIFATAAVATLTIRRRRRR
jgi:hypothetical protein